MSAGETSAAHRLFARAAASGAQPSGDAGAPAAGAAAPPRAPAGSGGCPVVGGAPAAAGAGGGCPVLGANAQPHSPNAPLPGQAAPLGTWRQPSTIPGAADGPADGSADSADAASSSSRTWSYPSEQMFFNAMRRKGWAPREADMPAVVAVHNAVNERAWREVRAWEAAAAGGGGGATGSNGAAAEPRLVEFRGRPRDHSPKARLLNLLGYRLPFDRHDWVVERGGGGGGGGAGGAGCTDGASAPPATRTRYVIDFYDAAAPGAPAAVHLDVRPALDSPAAAWARLRMQARWAASGRWRRE